MHNFILLQVELLKQNSASLNTSTILKLAKKFLTVTEYKQVMKVVKSLNLSK